MGGRGGTWILFAAAEIGSINGASYLVRVQRKMKIFTGRPHENGAVP